MQIRAAEATEHRHVVALLHQQLADHSLRPPAEALEAAVQEIMARPQLARILVAVVAGEIVGVAVLSFVLTLEHGGRAAWLEELYVEPAQRDRGIGTELVRAVCDVATAQGARAVDLEVEAGHERVQHLYERCGFCRHARQRWFLVLDGSHTMVASKEG